jgi:hypothetical protein
MTLKRILSTHSLVAHLSFYVCIQPLVVTAWTLFSHSNPNKAPLPSVFSHDHVNRRSAFGKIISLTAGIVSSGSVQEATAEPPLTLSVPPSSTSGSSTSTSNRATSKTSPTFEAYYLTPDETNVRSKLARIDSQRFLQQMASMNNVKSGGGGGTGGGAIWLGEHHNSAADHNFQATFIREVHGHRQKHFSRMSNSGSRKNVMAIGLEQVQQEFQPILDAYIEGKVSLDRMRFMVQWDKRWTWSFDNYKTIFETAKNLHIPLLALNVDSEDLTLVEKEGYPGLPKERLRKYIKDP